MGEMYNFKFLCVEFHFVVLYPIIKNIQDVGEYLVAGVSTSGLKSCHAQISSGLFCPGGHC